MIGLFCGKRSRSLISWSPNATHCNTLQHTTTHFNTHNNARIIHVWCNYQKTEALLEIRSGDFSVLVVLITVWYKRFHYAIFKNSGSTNPLFLFIFIGTLIHSGFAVVRITTHYNTLQQTATHCSKLQHTATCCNTHPFRIHSSAHAYVAALL